MKVVIAIAFFLIVASLASALFFVVKDKGRTHNAVHALALRVGLSVALFLFLLVSYKLGWIESRGIPVRVN